MMIRCALIGLAAALAIDASAQAIKLPPAAKRALVEKAMTLKKGDSAETVVERLGKPTVDNRLGVGGGGFITRSMKFYVVRSDRRGTEAMDEHIDVYLDKKDRVDGIFIQVELQ